MGEVYHLERSVDEASQQELLRVKQDELLELYSAWRKEPSVETEEHLYIDYGFYHPLDWSVGGDAEHENDLEGALAEVDEVRFEEHLAMCDGCAAYLDQMRSTIRVVGRLDPESIDLEACNRLVHAFQDWKAEPDVPGGG